MLSYIYSKKRLLLIILLCMFLLQAAVDVFQRRQGYYSEKEFSSNHESQKRNVGEKISTFLQDEVYNESFTERDIEVSLKNAQSFDSFKDYNKVKLKSFKDIEKSDLNIFFIESRCGTRRTSDTFGHNSTFNLRPRQCCSVESAAVMNPTRSVYIMHTCPLGPDFDLHLPRFARNMLNLSNVFLVPVSMAEALQGTPVNSLYHRGELEHSLYPIVHASDILRLVVLWRFGGTYTDMDVIFIRSLDLLGSNFCGLESQKLIGNAVLNFAASGTGHELLTDILVHVNTHFNGQVWIANGPELITNTMLRECRATLETVWQCAEFTVYNQTVLYPLQWKYYQDIFNASLGAHIVQQLKHTGVTVHLWNKFTAEFSVRVGSSQAYGLLADEFCPAVYRTCGDTF